METKAPDPSEFLANDEFSQMLYRRLKKQHDQRPAYEALCKSYDEGKISFREWSEQVLSFHCFDDN